MRRLGVVILLTALAGCTAARGPTVAGQPFEPQGMSGSIIVNGMTRADPLHERGVSRLGVAVVESSRIHVANVALTTYENQLLGRLGAVR